MSSVNKTKPILIISNLFVNYNPEEDPIQAVNDVSINLYEGETLGLVGESGCGKSTLGFAILNLLRGNGKITKGTIACSINNNYLNIASLEEYQLNKIRGKYVSMIFQASQDCLNPLQTIRSHLIDTLEAHEIPKSQHLKLIKNIFNDLEIPISRLDDYPFQFSGGMQQRIAIALALILNPQIVIADEPTTALDVLVQAKIINMLKRLKTDKNLSMIFISHDLGVIADVTSKVAVMYAGEIVEIGDTRDIFHNPLHPYTQGLIKAVPNIKTDIHLIQSIPGSPPDLKNPPSGCKFHPRCEFARKICTTTIAPFQSITNSTHIAKCHKLNPDFSNEEEIPNE
jgi:peptide/nickel transport system ATP-binding protein